MTFNTGNPIGSTDARDLSDNAENFDTALGTIAPTWVDRLGVTRDSFEGRLAKGSFYRVGDFATGYTLTNMRQTLEYSGHEYSWAGTFPKVVAAGATPATSGGISSGAWVDRTDVTLRTELSLNNGAYLVGNAAFYVEDVLEANVTGIPDKAIVIARTRNGATQGGGVFEYWATSSLTSDNGIVFTPTVGSGRLVRKGYSAVSGFIGTVEANWFGADNTGATSASAAIQSALTAAGVGGHIHFSKGTYLQTATLNGLANQRISGDHAESTVFYRTTDYGDTLYFAAAGSAHISGIWFKHSSWYDSSLSALPSKTTTGAHIHLKSGQNAIIENCYLWRGYVGISLDSCTITTVRKNWMMGVWDDENTAFQEGFANIYLMDANGPNEIVSIVENYITGAKSASRTITYSPSDGAQSISGTDNIGSRFGIYVDSCEDLLIANNFIGANDVAGIQSQCSGRHVSLDWRITGNFFDDGSTLYGGANIYFTSSASGYYVNGVTINGNVFNGELKGINAISAYNPANTSDPAVANFSIMGNTFQAFVGTPMQLLGARNGVISGNNITGVNSLGYGVTDPNYAAAIYLGGMASYVQVHGNNHGGLTNTGAVGGGDKLGIVNTGTNFGTNVVRDNMAVGSGSSAAGVGMEEDGVVILTATGSYQATASDRFVIFSKADTAAWSFGLPLNPRPGRKVTIKDGNGRAGIYAVQVVGNVDGTVNPTYNTAFFSKTFIYNGVLWNSI